VQDAHESVAQGAQSLVVGVAGGAMLVVVALAPGLADRAHKAQWSMAS
jgi:hypothetical protein